MVGIVLITSIWGDQRSLPKRGNIYVEACDWVVPG